MEPLTHAKHPLPPQVQNTELAAVVETAGTANQSLVVNSAVQNAFLPRNGCSFLPLLNSTGGKFGKSSGAGGASTSDFGGCLVGPQTTSTVSLLLLRDNFVAFKSVRALEPCFTKLDREVVSRSLPSFMFTFDGQGSAYLHC